MPPTVASVLWNPVPAVTRTLFKTTPSTAKTKEKPRTKYTVFKKIFNLADFLIVTARPVVQAALLV